MICVVVSLILANTAAGPQLERLLSTPVGISTDSLHLRFAVIDWINDGLMAVFFLLIGLEIKRELVEGELSSFKQAALPVLAAFGGAIVPAIIFYAINQHSEAKGGWGIPMATDIAFALAIISLLGSKVPASLKIFLAALAIVDDLIAILVIAIFYSGGLHTDYLLYSLAIFALLILLNRLKVKALWCYLLPGIFLWYFIHHSGIHATIAGVLTAMTIPTTKGKEESSLEKLEHILHRPVNFIIMPIFAFANTNISFAGLSTNTLGSSLSIGIMAGLLLGKPIGIFISSWLTVKSGLGKLPSLASWKHILGLGILGGIGFTMSIFISLLSFDDPHLQTTAKLSILLTSVSAGIIGYFLLASMQKKITTSNPR